MGYESRLYIVNVRRIPVGENGEEMDVFPRVIATVDLSKMYEGFRAIFTKPIDYKVQTDLGVYALSDDAYTDVDKYGDHMKSASLDEVIAYLETCPWGKGRTYRRIPPALGLLKALAEYEKTAWDCLEVVHYGY